jgi:hypothetical protein
MKKLLPLMLMVMMTGCAHLPTIGAGAAMTTAATLDLRSTFACEGCVERNPVSAMLYDPKHQGWLYAGNYALVGGVTAWTASLRRRRSPLWWVPATLVTTAYLYSWQHNQRVLGTLKERGPRPGPTGTPADRW